jgi:hypothetical protein
MRQDEVDRALANLSNDDIILPSSGFAASVMDALRREALAPPALPFPWKRAWPCFAACIFGVITLLLMALASHPPGPVQHSVLSLFDSAVKSQVAAIALALLTAFGGALFSVRLCRIIGRW